ncbi:hypothetical protein FF38_02255 [Lucilia cuprina]|uniref:Uncharacterized protein n=1 Tax=Lucilia cuprina TaxID=7375 RepID=A0A0L0CI41_LUCCU|nr:hypothetical protein FF38_02255 [Lucilia cuprina]
MYDDGEDDHAAAGVTITATAAAYNNDNDSHDVGLKVSQSVILTTTTTYNENENDDDDDSQDDDDADDGADVGLLISYLLIVSSSCVICTIKLITRVRTYLLRQPQPFDLPGHSPARNCTFVVADYVVFWLDPMSRNSKEMSRKQTNLPGHSPASKCSSVVPEYFSDRQHSYRDDTVDEVDADDDDHADHDDSGFWRV